MIAPRVRRSVPAGARIGAAVIAVAAVGGVGLQLWLSVEQTGSLMASVWIVLRYFTILTNLIICGVMTCLAIGHRPAPRVMFAATVAIVIVGIIYHALLARLWSPTGAGFAADHMLHTLVPILSFAFWLGFGQADTLQRRDVAGCLIWPLVYFAYALVRGIADGIYPYPFIDPTVLGWWRVWLNVAVLSAGLILLAAALCVVGRRLAHKTADL